MPAKKATKRRLTIKRPPPPLPESIWEPGGLTIILRIPPAILSPNGRSHWFAKASASKRARAQAKLTTLNLLRGYDPGRPVAYSLAYFWPSTRRDDDNAIASVKAYLDGICEAVGMDDRDLRFRALTHEKDRKLPRVEITLHFKS